MNKLRILTISFLLLAVTAVSTMIQAQGNQALDEKVKKFLASHEGKWHDLNVPTVDGQTLYDLVIKGNYKNALEIGTSTGYSGIWIAWALSKTGGKLTTIEIDEDRHKTALENFREAGLSDHIDARLGDAHKLVKELTGPFDFVFSDADKDWYKQYFIDVDPRLKAGGCFAAHNVRGNTGRGESKNGQEVFYDYIKGLSNYTTTVDNRGAGLSISYKKSK